jgi:hypothetical protein
VEGQSEPNRQEVLPPEALRAAREAGEAAILVGIPSYNNSRTIGHVVRAVQVGLAKYFPRVPSLIVNSDGGSEDGTQKIVQETQTHDSDLLLIAHPLSPVHRLITPYHGIPGKGSAFRCIFRVAELVGARACAVVDSDLRSIAPEWMQLLITPVLEGRFDYVAPYYARHKYDGTITNSIVYPLTRALYGQRVRQPIGGDFGFSGELASRFLSKPVWESDVARYGIDIWMTTTAICEGFRVCQSFLGAKIHDAKDPGADLSSMLLQVVGTLFRLMETYEPVWMGVQGSRDTPLLGFRFEVGSEPVAVDVARMVNHFRRGVADLSDIWKPVLAAADLERLRKLGSVEARQFQLDDELWVRVMYAFSTAYHRRVMDHQHLVRSCLPLYMGRVASFVVEVTDKSPAEVEDCIERLCLAFEELKPGLRLQWQASASKASAALREAGDRQPVPPRLEAQSSKR